MTSRLTHCSRASVAKRLRVGIVSMMAAALVLSSMAHACSVPVFRYALDRWPADPFVLGVSATDAQDETVARFLRNFTDSTPVNLAPHRLSTEAGPSRLAAPHSDPDAQPLWSGALDSHTLPQITDSPARHELAQRILAGETAVWVLVESGQRPADDRAATDLEKRLRYLENAAQLPPTDPDDPTSELGPGPGLRVKFSVLRVPHDDAGEQPFLAMLAGAKRATLPADAPWLALVFGRGRVLGAWPAAGFGNEQIDEACMFLLGACSCQVKRMNPGWDLLLNVDWDTTLQAMGLPRSSSLSAPSEVAQISNPSPLETMKVETVNFAAAPPPAVLPVARTSGRAAAAIAGALLAFAGVLAWRTRRSSP